MAKSKVWTKNHNTWGKTVNTPYGEMKVDENGYITHGKASQMLGGNYFESKEDYEAQKSLERASVKTAEVIETKTVEVEVGVPLELQNKVLACFSGGELLEICKGIGKPASNKLEREKIEELLKENLVPANWFILIEQIVDEFWGEEENEEENEEEKDEKGATKKTTEVKKEEKKGKKGK